MARLFVVGAIASGLFAVGGTIGCDKQETRDAAEKAGEGVKKAVVTVGDASRDAADKVGQAFEKAGDKMQDAAHDDTTTRPTTLP